MVDIEAAADPYDHLSNRVGWCSDVNIIVSVNFFFHVLTTVILNHYISGLESQQLNFARKLSSPGA